MCISTIYPFDPEVYSANFYFPLINFILIAVLGLEKNYSVYKSPHLFLPLPQHSLLLLTICLILVLLVIIYELILMLLLTKTHSLP